MARIDDLISTALKGLPSKPADSEPQATKKRYSELVSQVTAQAFAEELRGRGMAGARPAPPGTVGLSGAERRMSGGIGAKKVDVTWATEESGLVLGISVKSINFRDNRTQNFQKNLINRRSDMLMEAVTLHRRFPYAVMAGFFFLDEGAAHDHTVRRKSTFDNAHTRLKIFTGRPDPTGRDEQYERLYLILLNANQFNPTFKTYLVGSDQAVELIDVFDDLVQLVAERNSDFYECVDGDLVTVPH